MDLLLAWSAATCGNSSRSRVGSMTTGS